MQRKVSVLGGMDLLVSKEARAGHLFHPLLRTQHFLELNITWSVPPALALGLNNLLHLLTLAVSLRGRRLP